MGLVMVIMLFLAVVIGAVSIVFFLFQLYASLVISSTPFIILDEIIKRNGYVPNKYDNLKILLSPIVLVIFVGIQVIMFDINKGVFEMNMMLWKGI